MKKREPLMTQDYFDTRLKQIEGFIQQISNDLSLPAGEVYLDAVYHDLYTECFKLLVCQYSAGKDISTISATYDQCLASLFSYKTHPDSSYIFFNGAVDEYMNVLSLLTWGICLRLDQRRFEQLVIFIDNEGKRDALVDTLVKVRMKGREVSQKMCFPKLFGALYEATQSHSSDQMMQFLAKWYKTCLKATSTYNLHTLHGGVDSGFDGYWAWEVAGLTYALKLDDSSYQDMPYYPKDLVVYSRQ